MKMLRYSGLAVLVVCIAAFASGCGGGGGGGGTADEMVMECPQGQIGTYPDCMAPGPTDAELVADAQDTLDGILADARTREQAARSAAASVRVHDDATATQIANANANVGAAQDALADIITASGVANAATTPAEAEGAVDDARAARGDLITAQSAVASILSAVEAVATARAQREADEAAQTGGSSLIGHIRDNRKVYDDLLPLGAASIPDANIGPATTANRATFPYHTSGDGTVYPRPADADRGVMAVTITVGGTAVSSNSKTGRINVSGRLSQGFDLKGGGRFANAYTDIAVSSRVRDGIEEGQLVVDNTPDNRVDERYVYQDDPDYLLAGIWLDDSGASPSIQAFAYGNQPIVSSNNFCTAGDVTDTTSLDRTCGETTGLNLISTVLADDTDKTYTYRGNANGAYLADGKASFLKADVSLTAEFQDAGGDGSGSIGGEITNITAGGNRIDGSIELQEQDLTDDLTIAFTGTAAGVVGGNAYNGAWKGQFFGMRYDKKVTDPRVTVENAPDTQNISYTPGLPGSVAGTFYVNKLTGTGGDAAFIGAFGASR